MITENLAAQRSDEWHIARIGKITGSRIASVLDISPFKTREALVREMVQEVNLGEPAPFTSNPAMKWGTDHEDTAALQASFEESTSFVPGGLFENDKYPGLAYSPDGMNQDKGILLEVKCPYGLREVQEPEFKSINDMPHYMAQIQLGMNVMDLDVCLFYQWTPFGVRAEYVSRQKDYLETLAPTISQFFGRMDDCLGDQEYLDSLMARFDPEFEMLAQEYKAAVQAEKFAKDRVARVKDELIALAPHGGFNNTLSVTKVKGGARVDWKSVAKDHVLALEELELDDYTKMSADSFRINIK